MRKAAGRQPGRRSEEAGRRVRTAGQVSGREYERRQRALRRQRAIRRQRRRARRCLIAGAALIAAVFLLPRAFGFLAQLRRGAGGLPGSGDAGSPAAEAGGTPGNPVLAQGSVDEAILEGLRETWRDKPEAAEILAHPENYPDALLELLNKRPETLQFVKDYPSKWNRKAEVDISGEIEKGTIPFFYQWDGRWGYDGYGRSIVALAGCGPTCLSMVLADLLGDASLHPGAVAAFSERSGYLTENGTSWDLMTLGAGELGITGEVLPLDENRMIAKLQSGHPIICSMRPGDFTDVGHFVVLAGYEDGAFLIHDPNSIENSGRSWTYERIRDQIRNLWVCSP